jgi:hypothetical protein
LSFSSGLIRWEGSFQPLVYSFHRARYTYQKGRFATQKSADPFHLPQDDTVVSGEL